jgi:hypothetical protein
MQPVSGKDFVSEWNQFFNSFQKHQEQKFSTRFEDPCWEPRQRLHQML